MCVRCVRVCGCACLRECFTFLCVCCFKGFPLVCVCVCVCVTLCVRAYTRARVCSNLPCALFVTSTVVDVYPPPSRSSWTRCLLCLSPLNPFIIQRVATTLTLTWCRRWSLPRRSSRPRRWERRRPRRGVRCCPGRPVALSPALPRRCARTVSPPIRRELAQAEAITCTCAAGLRDRARNCGQHATAR